MGARPALVEIKTKCSCHLNAVYRFSAHTDEADTPADSPVHEFVSDAYQSQTMSKDLEEVQEGIKRLGTQSSKKPNGI